MAGKKQLAITERQFAALEVLWERGPLTVREVLPLLPGEPAPYTTVLGLLQGMERAGLVAHGGESPAHRYRPLLDRAGATGALLGDFVKRFFRGSASRLVLGLVDAEQLSPEELRAIEEKLTPPAPEQAPPKPRRGGKR